MIATRNRPGTLVLAAAGALVAAAIVWRSATLIANGSLSGAFLLAGLAAAPFALYAMWRAPLLFPFGLFAALVPYDALLQVGGTGANFSRFVGYLVFGAFTLFMIRTRTMLRPTANWYPWLFYVAWASLTTLWSINQTQSLYFMPVMMQLLAVLTLCAIYPVRGFEIRALPWIIILSGTSAAIVEIAFAHSLYGTRATVEINGNFLDPNHFCAYFMLPLGLAIARFSTSRSLTERALTLVIVCLICVAILKSGSRGGFVGTGVVLAYSAFATRRYLQIGFLAAAGLVLSALNPVVWQRFTDPTQGDFGGRAGFWQIGLHAFPQYWALGAGFGSFPDVDQDNYFSVFQPNSVGWGFPAHNLIIQSSLETGVVGLAAVLLAWWMSFRQNRFIPRGHELYWMRIGSESIMFGLFVSALTIDMLWWKYLWVAISFTALVSNAARPRYLIAPTARARRSAPPRENPLPARASPELQPLPLQRRGAR